MIETTQHDRFVSEDYALLRNIGITTIRDAMLMARKQRRQQATLLPPDWASV